MLYIILADTNILLCSTSSFILSDKKIQYYFKQFRYSYLNNFKYLYIQLKFEIRLN